ncbi:hypothetical protein EMIT079MI2_10636 [Bacillus sp. IT-79MI2]
MFTRKIQNDKMIVYRLVKKIGLCAVVRGYDTVSLLLNLAKHFIL